jgi:hypothetical protein
MTRLKMVVLRNEPNFNPLRCWFGQSTSNAEREHERRLIPSIRTVCLARTRGGRHCVHRPGLKERPRRKAARLAALKNRNIEMRINAAMVMVAQFLAGGPTKSGGSMQSRHFKCRRNWGVSSSRKPRIHAPTRISFNDSAVAAPQ